jgi:hypothetical protein
MYLTVNGYEWDDNTSDWVGEYRETLYWTSTSIGIPEITTTPIKVYPNPVSDVLHVDLNTAAETTVKLYNLSGQLLFAEAIKEQSASIDVSSYMPGLYVLVFEQSGNTVYKKVMVN